MKNAQGSDFTTSAPAISRSTLPPEKCAMAKRMDDAQAAIDHIREQVDAHHVVGDLAGRPAAVRRDRVQLRIGEPVEKGGEGLQGLLLRIGGAADDRGPAA